MTLSQLIRNSIGIAITSAVLAICFAGCSTTRKLREGEVLYDGIRKIEIKSPDGTKIDSDVEENVKLSLSVKPNNSLFGSTRFRNPLAIGLWTYNYIDPKSKGLKGLIYKMFAEEPILIDENVRPAQRTKMAENILDNSGYFQGVADFDTIMSKDGKKAKLVYKINTGPVYRIKSVTLFPDESFLTHKIDSVAARHRYLHPGVRYSVDSLVQVRTDIANALRNHGFYYFRPNHIEYLADSTGGNNEIDLKLVFAKNIHHDDTVRYYMGDLKLLITRRLNNNTDFDTIQTSRGTILKAPNIKFRKGLMDDCVTLRRGRAFSIRSLNRTQSNFSRLGIFRSMNFNVTRDSTATQPTLNVDITAQMASALEGLTELNIVSKSNSYLGPGVALGITHYNLFGGGEQLSLKGTGSYEWQTGRHSGGKGSLFNSYQFGIKASLSFPRLLAPSFIPRSRRSLNWTKISLSGEILNRPKFFSMRQFNMSISYDWQTSRYATNSLKAFSLSNTKLSNATEEFENIMEINPVIAQSFRDQLIPKIEYTYTYERAFGKWRKYNWMINVQEAGNLIYLYARALGKKRDLHLFGSPFSQYIKAQAQLVFHQRVTTDSWLVTRLATGVAHAYCNSTEVPYSEQFYVGGANSIRAFNVRGVGPGRFHREYTSKNDYFDQTGTFKFEFNTEYRFPIWGYLRGAVFIDAGNVWLLKEDETRPGGKLNAKYFFRDLALGTGIGLRFDMSMVVVRADLGFKLHAPYDTGKRGYFNITTANSDIWAFHLAIGYPF